MPPDLLTRPETGTYPELFAAYIDAVPDGSLLEILDRQIAEREDLAGLSESEASHRYAPGKWTLKEVLGHVTDTERILSTRALRFARNDVTPLPGFDQDPYTEASNHDARPLAGLLAEWQAVRRATIALFASFDAAMLDRSGEAEGRRISVRALAWTIAGHEIHHREVIRERYL